MSRPRRWGKEGVLPRKGVTDLTRPPPSSGHPHASALSVSLLSAWIVAQLRRGNFKRLQGQDRQSVMPEKLVGGMEGRPGAGQGVAGEDMTQGCRPPPPQQPKEKAPPFLGLQAGQDRWKQSWRHQVEVGPGVLHPP